ncbi:hypothetical protein CEXT_311321 [Caerostris extrusa]|uniref:Uncharacterized protein n=1 Tax=Caerostris extrusa TaxID=172846 RepID=A0AAV4N403_CAEEX|nr:hypothetical protein CEXT_311321 [Caerostris extrusa]
MVSSSSGFKIAFFSVKPKVLLTFSNVSISSAPINQNPPYLMHPRGEEEFTSATEPTSNGQQPAVRKLDQLRIQDEENNNKNAA